MGYNVLVDGIYSGYKSLILTFDPNFQRDIEVYSLPNTFSGQRTLSKDILKLGRRIPRGILSNSPPFHPHRSVWHGVHGKRGVYRYVPSLKTNSSHLKMDGWNNTSFVLGWPTLKNLVSQD